MLIKQKRVQKLSKLENYKSKEITFIVPLNNHTMNQAIKAGFSSSLQVNESIVPSPLMGHNCYVNSEGKTLILKDLPKETVYYDREWCRNQYCGYKKTEYVCSIVSIPRLVYPRTKLEPENIHLKIQQEDDKKFVITEPIVYNDENYHRVKLAINILLEIFGFCYINEYQKMDFYHNLKEVPWEILGTKEGINLYKHIKSLYTNKNNKTKPQEVVISRYDFLKSIGLQPIAKGKSGFLGYIVYQVANRKIFVFESIYTQNATYIFKDDWKDISKLSKSEIMLGNKQYKRIIHIKDWETELRKTLKKIV